MNNVPFSSSLRTRLLAFGLVAILPAIVFLAIDTAQDRAYEDKRARDDMLRLVRLLGHEHETRIEATRQLLLVIAEAHADFASNPVRCSAALARVLKESPAYQNLSIATPDGDVVCSARPSNARVNIADRAYFQTVLREKRFIVGDFVVARSTGKPAVFMVQPLLDAAGGVKLVATAGLDLSWISARAEGTGLPADSAVALIDAGGTIIARSREPEKWTGKRASKGEFYELASTARDAGTYVANGSLDGIARYWAYTPLTQSGPRNPYLTVGIPTDTVFATSNNSTRLGITAIVLSLAIGALLIWFGADAAVLRRIRAIDVAMRRWSGGDTSARTGLQSQNDELGGLAASFDTMADIVARHQTQLDDANRALAISEANFRATFELAATGIVVRNMAGKRLEVNQHFCDLLGYTREELLAMPVDGIAIDADLELSREFIARLTSGQLQTYTRDKPVRHKDGTILMTEVAVSVVNGEDGKPDRVISAFTDITERQRAQDEILRLNQQLERRVEERTAELEALTYSVAHDLRAPMRAIDGYAKIVMREHTTGMDAQGHRYLENMSEAARRMGKLLEDLLELMHLGRKQMQISAVDLGRMAWKLDRQLRERHPHRDLEFICPQTLTTHADGALVAVALECLLDNAWKFTAGTARARVEFGSVEAGGERVYFVRDNGVGFDMRYVDKLFGPFQRLHDAKDFPGTGIGLALVARAAKRHGGRAWAESGPEASCFFFTLAPEAHKTS